MPDEKSIVIVELRFVEEHYLPAKGLVHEVQVIKYLYNDDNKVVTRIFGENSERQVVVAKVDDMGRAIQRALWDVKRMIEAWIG